MLLSFVCCAGRERTIKEHLHSWERRTKLAGYNNTKSCVYSEHNSSIATSLLEQKALDLTI